MLLLAGTAVLILASPASASARVLSVNVSPDHVVVGERTCFSFEVTGGGGNPVGGSDVVLEGAADKTNDRGEARICTRLDWAGRHSALVLKKDYRVSAATIDASSHLLQNGLGSWIYVQYYLAAYDGEGTCYTFEFGDGKTGGCQGHFTATNDPFGPQPGDSDWSPRSGTIFLHMYIDNLDQLRDLSDFRGYVPNARSAEWYIEGAFVDGWQPSGCTNEVRACLVSGTDPTKTGQPGGPLYLNVEYHHPFLQNPGYSFDMHGYVRSRCPC